METDQSQPPLNIGILALPETTPLSVYGLYEIFSTVGTVWDALTGERHETRQIRPAILAKTLGQFQSSIGTPIAPHRTLDEPGPLDILIVTDIRLPFDETAPSRWVEEMAWTRRLVDHGTQVCSVCTGAIFLAEAGLLDGSDAASHWSAAPLFRDRYPNVHFKPERILCNSGREGRLITTGGASSWEDLALHIIARYCGREEAARMAKLFVLGDRSDGQLPYAVMARPRDHSDAVIAECQVWLADNYTIANPVTRLVERSGLAERTFKRRFKQATGYAPVAYVQALRMEEAKQMLESGDQSPEEIAASVGYEDPTFFRRLFKRHAGVTPSRYRQRYRFDPGLH